MGSRARSAVCWARRPRLPEMISRLPWSRSGPAWHERERSGAAMKFLYSSGQRPLDGFTLKRGIGRGGFGEVYYAVSDGGKEVALKLVRGGNLEVELRGMAQCLNLKHPHLVSLYDLRSDPQGDHWVIMEYIAGEPLNVVLSRHPDGLPEELAQQWF